MTELCKDWKLGLISLGLSNAVEEGFGMSLELPTPQAHALCGGRTHGGTVVRATLYSGLELNSG